MMIAGRFGMEKVKLSESIVQKDAKVRKMTERELRKHYAGLVMQSLIIKSNALDLNSRRAMGDLATLAIFIATQMVIEIRKEEQDETR